jgi:hypothetical protein
MAFNSASKNLTYYFAQPLNDKNFHCIYQLSATQLYGVILRILRQEQLDFHFLFFRLG